MKSYKTVLLILIMTILTLFQVGITRVSNDLTPLTLPLITIICSVLLLGYHFAIIHSLISGFFLDLFSPLPFGIHIGLLFIIVISGHILTRSILSKKSALPVMSLAFFSTSFYYIALELSEFISSSISNIEHSPFFSGHFLFWLILCSFVNALFVGLIYRISLRAKIYKLKPYIVN